MSIIQIENGLKEMNDFTKEELILILKFLRGAYSIESDGCELKAEKIQSLIDNYCEHESKINIGEAPMICKKCGKVTG